MKLRSLSIKTLKELHRKYKVELAVAEIVITNTKFVLPQIHERAWDEVNFLEEKIKAINNIIKRSRRL